MFKEKIQIFIDGAVRYFNHTPDKSVTVGTPYLAESDDPIALDMTGLIGISGPNKGCVYFSAPRILLKHLLLSIGEKDTSERNMIDMVGEVANTIAGNARSSLGKDFMISVPVVIEGPPTTIHLPIHSRAYVIPVTWKSYTAAIVVCLEQN